MAVALLSLLVGSFVVNIKAEANSPTTTKISASIPSCWPPICFACQGSGAAGTAGVCNTICGPGCPKYCNSALNGPYCN